MLRSFVILLRVFVALFFVLATQSMAVAANNENVGKALKSLMAGPPVEMGSRFANANYESIKAFYGTRSFKPVWSRDSGPKGKAKALFAELRASVTHGLSPEFYGVSTLEKLMKSKVPADLARMDLLFTGALVEFSHDLLNGRLTNDTENRSNQIQPVQMAPADLVEQAAAAGNLRVMLGGIVGDDRRYVRLVSKMVEYQRIGSPGKWPSKPLPKDLDPTAESDHMLAVRRMLALTGDLEFQEMKSSGPIDRPLSDALARYQRRQGVASNGKLDARTIALLNTPLTTRVNLAKVNLERRRWQNRPANDNLLYLNLVDGQLKLLVNDKTTALVEVANDNGVPDLPTFYGDVVSIERLGSSSKPRIRLQFLRDKLAGDDTAKTGELVLDDTKGKARALLQQSLLAADQATLKKLGAGKKMKLATPVDLFVTYLTVWATRDGRIQFRPDVLNRDAGVMKRLGL